MTARDAVRGTAAGLVMGLLCAQGAMAEDRSMSFQTSDHGAYLTARDGGGSDLFANKYQPAEWETFRVLDRNGEKLRSGDPICLRTSNGHFVVAENGGGRETKANRRECGPWETFQIVLLSGPGGYPVTGNAEIPAFHGFRNSVYVGLRASDGSWVVAENGGGGPVNANRPGFGRWERFRIFHH